MGPCPLQSVRFCLVCTTASAGLFDACTVEPSGTLNILLQHSWDIMSITLFLPEPAVPVAMGRRPLGFSF